MYVLFLINYSAHNRNFKSDSSFKIIYEYIDVMYYYYMYNILYDIYDIVLLYVCNKLMNMNYKICIRVKM